jgi:signal transduction histidine kinase
MTATAAEWMTDRVRADRKSHNELTEGVKNLLRSNDTLLTESRERESAMNQLRRSEAYLAEAQRLTKTGSWAFTPGKEGWNYWSDELFRILEVDPRQGPLLHELMYQLVHPEDRQQVVDRYLKALNDKEDYVLDHRMLYPDGRLKYFHTTGHPIFNDAGEIAEFVGTSVDVTEQKRIEEALRRSEAYLAEGQRLTHTGSWSLNVATRQIFHSSAEHTRMFGFDPEKGLPSFEDFLQRIHPEDQEDVLETLQTLMRSGEDLDLRYRIVAPDCPVRYMHAIGHPVLRKSSTPGEYVGITIDITERRRLDQEREEAENRLRRSEAYLAEAQRLGHTGSWALDPATGKIIYYSEEMFRIMGLEPTLDPPDLEVIWRRFHPDDLPPVIEGVERTVAASEKSWIVSDQTTGSPGLAELRNELQGPMGTKGDEVEIRVILPDGTLKYVRWYGHPILDKTGQFVEFVGTAMDVTERKKAEFERDKHRQLEADLAHMNRISMLGELTASISHELKQPITAGIINAQTALRWLAKDQPNVEEACQSVTNAVKAGERAVEIIQRLRSLYTKAPPRCELLDGNKIIGELVEMLRTEADRYGVAINTDFTTEVPMIRSDRVQLQQVLMNLMLNAIEAMKETGGSLSVKSRLNQEGLFQISVSDTGPGLPAAKEKQIFEPFFTTKPQGSGMGLAICRSIVESHGGCLWVAPNGDRGACFNFTLPVANHYET